MHGANFSDRINRTIAFFPITDLHKRSRDGRTALMQAIDIEDYAVASALLYRYPKLTCLRLIDPETTSYTYPIHFAAQILSDRDTDEVTKIVELLLLQIRG